MRAGQPATETDYWQRAIQLARRGLGQVSPNPAVGALLVKDGQIIGEGWHRRHGDLHAEREALADAGRKGIDPAGATVFVTLEPCAHAGSQPPCAEALIDAGVAEVVIGAEDPTAKTRGIGPSRLVDAGVKLRWAKGEAAAASLDLVQDFRKRALVGKPLVTLKIAMSLDGKVATSGGDSKWISGEESRALVHRWRAEMDAVAVGSGTLAADNPRLTARPETDDPARGPVRQPTRVIFDSELRSSPDAALFDDIALAPLLLVSGPEPDPGRRAALEHAGARVIAIGGDRPGERFAAAMEALAAAGIGSVLLEGGPTLAGAAISAGEVDRLEIFVAPLVLGGGRAATEGPGPELMADAKRTDGIRATPVGQDVLMSSTLRIW